MKSLVFKPGLEALRQIELYMDNLCENLFINETYYGNLIISLNTLNERLFELGQNSAVKLTYNTDHIHLSFVIEGVENQVYTSIIEDKSLNNNDITLELLNQLCDSMVIENSTITLDFEVGALHNSIYKTRVNLLKKYFKKDKINSVDV
ncbi:MAG: hypothetical protein C0595_07540 [Marinilabiliales bacterium]|nr:MAG: hypothetical protein C0595_07540 [Marinilabiliales bacterium]